MLNSQRKLCLYHSVTYIDLTDYITHHRILIILKIAGDRQIQLTVTCVLTEHALVSAEREPLFGYYYPTQTATYFNMINIVSCDYRA